MEITIVLLLLLMGVIFFLLELFLIPGVSVAGIAGTIFMGGAVYYAYTAIDNTAGHLTLAGGLILLAIAVYIFIRSKALDKMSLKTEIEGKNDPLNGIIINIGDRGICASRLAPMGRIKINGHLVEAKTYDDFIDEGESVTVVEVLNTNVVVERTDEG
ncbi:MAG: NfeD family protein [Paludibacteraceae bacterium]|nr:NfeD family protein [Paludibacteraceae bacterium]